MTDQSQLLGHFSLMIAEYYQTIGTAEVFYVSYSEISQSFV